MSISDTILSKQDKEWILELRIRRLTDNKEVLIYPMGAERYLSLVLIGNKKGRYNIRADIEEKNVLVLPGYGNSAFLFAQSGAKSITVCDKDPVTIAWLKAFKKYYHYRIPNTESNESIAINPSIGELLTALTCWYPPLITLPSGRFINVLCWMFHAKALRLTYIFYMLSVARHAIQSQVQGDFELNKDIQFCVGEINQLELNKNNKIFDTAFVPYLLGVKNGIESSKDIVDFIKKMTKIIPKGRILVTPTRSTKEFFFTGQQYFTTTGYSSIQAIPGLEQYIKGQDKYWFKTQGLTLFGNSSY